MFKDYQQESNYIIYIFQAFISKLQNPNTKVVKSTEGAKKQKPLIQGREDLEGLLDG